MSQNPAYLAKLVGSWVDFLKLNVFWDLGFTVFFVGIGSWYLLEKEARSNISYLRQSLFYAALCLILILSVGPLPRLALKYFWMHMIQHISLMMLIAPMLVLGEPVTVAVNSKYLRVRRTSETFLKNPVTRFLLKAPVGFAIFLVVLIGTHFSPLADAGMLNSNVHSFEIVLFLLGGFIYYYSVMDGNPQPWPVSHQVRVISLFAMMVPETMVGFFLYSGNTMMHSLPKTISKVAGLADQHQGGSIMWAMGMLIDSVWVVIATKDWFTDEQRLAEEEDESATYA